jgi:hypothetical protein
MSSPASPSPQTRQPGHPMLRPKLPVLQGPSQSPGTGADWATARNRFDCRPTSSWAKQKADRAFCAQAEAAKKCPLVEHNSANGFHFGNGGFRS